MCRAQMLCHIIWKNHSEAFSFGGKGGEKAPSLQTPHPCSCARALSMTIFLLFSDLHICTMSDCSHHHKPPKTLTHYVMIQGKSKNGPVKSSRHVVFRWRPLYLVIWIGVFQKQRKQYFCKSFLLDLFSFVLPNSVEFILTVFILATICLKR